MRLISIVCSVASMGLFGWLAWRRFCPPVAVTATALFALCDKLIWHAAEVKQYSGDVFSALLLLSLAVGLRRPVQPLRRLWLIAGVCAIVLWFSFPAIFVFGAISLMLLGKLLRHVRWKRVSPAKAVVAFASANLLVVISFLILYRLTIYAHAGNLDLYWREHLADWSRPMQIPWWIISEIYSLCDHPYRSLGFLVLPLAGAGAIALFREGRRDLLWVCVGPIGFALLAALADQYPFTGERITLFLVPGFFLLVAAGLEWASRTATLERWWIILAAPMLLVGLRFALPHLVHPHMRSAMRPIAQYVREHRQDGEAICLVGEGTSPIAHFTCGRNLELLCYWSDVPGPLYGAPGTPVLKDVWQISEKRFWIVFAALPEHCTRYMSRLLEDTRAGATEVEHESIPGGGAYLFEKN
jgi:hypothetical protein